MLPTASDAESAGSTRWVPPEPRVPCTSRAAAARRLREQSQGTRPHCTPATAPGHDSRQGARRQNPLAKRSTYRGVMLHRVTDVQHFSLRGSYRPVGTFPAEESWGRGAMEQAAGELRCWTMGSGAAEAVPGMLCWPPVCGLLAFFAFFISLSSVN